MNHKYLILIAALLAVLSCTGTRKATDSTSQVSTPPQASATPFGLTAEELKQVDFKRPVSFIRNGENYTHFKLAFTDTSTRTIKKVFDRIDNNPYKQDGDALTYDIKAKLTDLVPDTSIYYHYQDSVIWAEVLPGYLQSSKNYNIAPFYSLVLHGKNGFAGAKSELLLFNQKGEKLFTYSAPNFHITSGAITDNGKYILIHAEGVYGEDFRLHSDILEIFNTETNKLIYRDTIGFSGVGNSGNLLIYRIDLVNSFTKFHILNMDEMIMYTRVFSIDEVSRMRYRTEDGYVIKVNLQDTTNTYTLRFDKDFEAIELKTFE